MGLGVAPAFAPDPEGMGNPLRSVVSVDVELYFVESEQLLQHGHQVLCLTSPADPDGAAEAILFIDHVLEVEPMPIVC